MYLGDLKFLSLFYVEVLHIVSLTIDRHLRIFDAIKEVLNKKMS